MDTGLPRLQVPPEESGERAQVGRRGRAVATDVRRDVPVEHEDQDRSDRHEHRQRDRGRIPASPPSARPGSRRCPRHRASAAPATEADRDQGERERDQPRDPDASRSSARPATATPRTTARARRAAGALRPHDGRVPAFADDHPGAGRRQSRGTGLPPGGRVGLASPRGPVAEGSPSYGPTCRRTRPSIQSHVRAQLLAGRLDLARRLPRRACAGSSPGRHGSRRSTRGRSRPTGCLARICFIDAVRGRRRRCGPRVSRRTRPCWRSSTASRPGPSRT